MSNKKIYESFVFYHFTCVGGQEAQSSQILLQLVIKEESTWSAAFGFEFLK